jgi:hypothetical protein
MWQIDINTQWRVICIRLDQANNNDNDGNNNNNCYDVLFCRMSAIAVGNQRETVKDMVLADYQVPKGVSILQIRNKCFWHMTQCGLVITSRRQYF